MVKVNLSERNARTKMAFGHILGSRRQSKSRCSDDESMLLEIFQLLQRHGNGLEKVEREV